MALQPWLYPVNGDTSDWMLEELGIIAYSPEVPVIFEECCNCDS